MKRKRDGIPSRPAILPRPPPASTFPNCSRLFPAAARTPAPKTFAGQVGAEIRRRREQKKLSVEQAAGRAGVPVQTWYKYEKGILVLNRLPAIAKALGCKARQIIPD